MEKKRIDWIDNVRGVCVFCVLLAHSSLNHNYLYMLYTPWFLTCFFFISGLLYKNISFRSDMHRIVKHLFLPYLMLNFILLLLGVDNWKALINGNYNYIIEKIKDIIMGYPMWFIPCLIIVQTYFVLLVYTIMKSETSKLIISIVLLFSVYAIKNQDYYTAPWYIDIALFSSSFFVLGNIVKNRFGLSNWFEGINNKHIWSIILLIIYIAFSLILQANIDMEFHYAYNYYKFPILFIITSFAGIFSICFLFQSYSFSLLTKLGKNSLAFFAFNGKAKAIVLFLLPNSVLSNSYIGVLVLSFCESIILIMLSFLINKYCPFIVGKYHK